MMKLVKTVCSLVAISALSTGTAYGLSIDATITADNHYALYKGKEDGSGLQFIGKGEADDYTAGIPSWKYPESYNFDLANDEYVYVVAWSDDDVAQGWIGQFVSPVGATYSNDSDWEFISTNQDLDSGYNWTSSDESHLMSYISDATSSDTWNDVTYSIDNGGKPWSGGTGELVSGIDGLADWIWGGPLRPGGNYGEYLVFRSPLSGNEVPEPATMLLMGLGLAGIAGARRKCKRS